jgi:hypothetical protein
MTVGISTAKLILMTVGVSTDYLPDHSHPEKINSVLTFWSNLTEGKWSKRGPVRLLVLSVSWTER